MLQFTNFSLFLTVTHPRIKDAVKKPFSLGSWATRVSYRAKHAVTTVFSCPMQYSFQKAREVDSVARAGIMWRTENGTPLLDSGDVVRVFHPTHEMLELFTTVMVEHFSRNFHANA